jgi:inhibitor of cysteine peptidase
MTQITVTGREHDTRVRMGRNDTLVVRLSENPTTGYLWQVTVSGVLAMAGSSLEAIGQAVGGGGMRVLTFTAHTPGEARIQAQKRRQWEAGATPQEEFVLHVDVDG